MRSSSPGSGSLTHEQLLAVGSPHRRLYVEAAPGSGKTTVSAQRFGLHRFASAVDHRAVVAISFTRSATEEMRSRVLRHWGPSALAWPHRVVTLDTVLYGLLAHLLQTGVLQARGSPGAGSPGHVAHYSAHYLHPPQTDPQPRRHTDSPEYRLGPGARQPSDAGRFHHRRPAGEVHARQRA
ncbi:UvrD-helicase domain-containing protein [Streptomyces sp. NBC_00827]|uniref:UvrD-helicase domain-containing protein n=1 Tax=Streptomyces sp. NBC_00827 TaxID=2903677 RepID=UPI00386D22CB